MTELEGTADAEKVRTGRDIGKELERTVVFHAAHFEKQPSPRECRVLTAAFSLPSVSCDLPTNEDDATSESKEHHPQTGSSVVYVIEEHYKDDSLLATEV